MLAVFAEMPRKYTRKTSRMQWTVEQLNNAKAAILGGMSIRAASTAYLIPRTTLRQHMKARHPTQTVKLGSKVPVFNPAQEEELVQHLLDLENRFYGLTMRDVQELAFELAEKNNLPHTFNKDKRMAGKDWLVGFLERNPKIAFRKPEATSTARARAFNKPAVNKYFGLLASIMQQKQFDPTRIYNADETAVCTVSNVSCYSQTVYYNYSFFRFHRRKRKSPPSRGRNRSVP